MSYNGSFTCPMHPVAGKDRPGDFPEWGIPCSSREGMEDNTTAARKVMSHEHT